MTLRHLLLRVCCAFSLGGAVRAAELSSPNIFYTLPGSEFTEFYNEVTVLESVTGSYFAATGFSAGYAGLQEGGSLGGKQVQFSIWDPGQPNSSASNTVSANQVEVIWASPETVVQRFGGEGIGVATATPFDWQVGLAYRFLIRADRAGSNITYRGYVFDPTRNRWMHLATLRTRFDTRRFNGFYSFVEDFRGNATSQAQTRRALYGNTWARLTDGSWRELTSATAGAGSSTQPPNPNYRVTTNGPRFELANGGAIAIGTPAGNSITRAPGGASGPTLPAASAPVIERGPVDTAAFANAHTALTVEASGEGLKYQWLRDGAVIPNETSARLILSTAGTPVTSPTYAVRITNPYGSVTSSGARITLSPNPRATLVQGVNRLALPPSVGVINPAGGEWLPIVETTTEAGTRGTFAAVRTSGAGRVAAIGHEGFLEITAESNLTFTANLLRWLGGRTNPRIVYSTAHREWVGSGFANAIRGTALTATEFSGLLPPAGTADVLVIGNAWGEFTAAEIIGLQNWVNAGGGLLLAGLGWSWGPYNDNRPLSDYPMTKLAAPFGATWSTMTFATGVTSEGFQIVTVPANLPPPGTGIGGAPTSLTDQLVAVGGRATFSVSPGNSETIRWSLNGAVIPDQTASQLIISSVHAGLNGGRYEVTLTDNYGSKRSLAGRLFVRGAGDTPILHFTRSPESLRPAVGSSAVASASAQSSGALSYQWFKDGMPIPGATSTALGIADVTSSENYDLVATSATGAITSNLARIGHDVSLTFTGPIPTPDRFSQLVNLSVITMAGAGDRTLTVGFVLGGEAYLPGGKSLLLRGAGPSLGLFGVPAPLADPELRLFAEDSTALLSNDNWAGAALSAAFTSTGAFPFAPNSRDAALLVAMPRGAYSVQINARSASGLALIEAYDVAPAATAPRFVNLSTRSVIAPDADTLTAGFVIRGDAQKTLLIRGVGPTLAAFGLAGTLADPALRLVNGATIVATNDNWSTASNAGEVAAAATRTGAFALPAGSRDAALLVTLPPGNYSAQATGVGGASGIVLLEIYEVQ